MVWQRTAPVSQGLHVECSRRSALFFFSPIVICHMPLRPSVYSNPANTFCALGQDRQRQNPWLSQGVQSAVYFDLGFQIIPFALNMCLFCFRSPHLSIPSLCTWIVSGADRAEGPWDRNAEREPVSCMRRFERFGKAWQFLSVQDRNLFVPTYPW